MFLSAKKFVAQLIFTHFSNNFLLASTKLISIWSDNLSFSPHTIKIQRQKTKKQPRYDQMLFSRVRFWILAVVLVVYIAGVLIWSAVSPHETKNVGYRITSDLGHRQDSNMRNPDLGFPAVIPPRNRSKINWCTELKYLDPPREPIALASFPGSGNTWLRYLLQQATGVYTGSVYKDRVLLKDGFPAESVLNGSVLVVKTHEWGPKARSNFSKAILLVRSPGAAFQAEFNRQSGGHIGFASPDKYKRSKDWQQYVSDQIRDWQKMNLDWLYNFIPTHVIFYEQLIDNVEHTLLSVMKFIEVPINEEMLKCAIERKEGIYKRKKRVLNFDPYTSKMKEQLKIVQEKVYNAIYNWTPATKRRWP